MRWVTAFACGLGCATVGLGFAPALAVEPEPGLWEVQKSVARAGASELRPLRTRCISAEQASRLAQPPAPNVTAIGAATCKTFDLHKTNTGITWTTQCPSLAFRLIASYVGDTSQHYVWTFRRETVLVGQVLASSTVTIEGKRVGECPK